MAATLATEVSSLITGYGSVRITSSNRTWEKQLEIILDPKNASNYPNIKKRFLAKFKLRDLPAYKDLSDKEKNWWCVEIMKQAGLPGGFAHVGGKAVDIWVGDLTETYKNILKTTLEASGKKILLEKVVASKSNYKVDLKEANVFHITN